MTITRRITAAAAVLAIAGSGAAASQAATTVDRVDVKGAYAFMTADGLVVEFKTAQALPRKASGSIRASAALDRQLPGSISSGRRRGASCYGFIAEAKNTKIGSKHKLKVTARGTDGDVSDTATVKVIGKRAAGAARKRLGC
jgi:hypothetical protein